MKNRHSSWILKKAAALLIALTLLMSALPAALAVTPDWSELQITVSWINAATGETAYANATPVYDAEGNFWIMLPPEAPLDGLTIFVTHPNEAYQIWPAAGEALGYVTVVGDTMDGINYLPGEDLGEVFRRLCLFVRPGGLLIFDVKSPESLRAKMDLREKQIAEAEQQVASAEDGPTVGDKLQHAVRHTLVTKHLVKLFIRNMSENDKVNAEHPTQE